MEAKEPQKTNYFVLVLILVGTLFLFYNIFKKEKPPKPSSDIIYSAPSYQTASPGYTLLKTSLNNKRAFNVQVRISSKISEGELQSLAQKIKAEKAQLKIERKAWLRKKTEKKLLEKAERKILHKKTNAQKKFKEKIQKKYKSE